MPDNVQILHSGIGRLVQDARRRRGLTQVQAARILQMSRRKLLDIEADRVRLARYEKAGILSMLLDEETSED